MKRSSTRLVPLLLASIVVSFVLPLPATYGQDQARPTFRASIALVPITAAVRDSHNRIVRDLARDDFQVLENGGARSIVDFKATDHGPLSVAILFDTSGSMQVASNLEKGKETVEQFLNWVQPASDEVALFTFDKAIREEVPFTSDIDRVQAALRDIRAWGLTSLHDAIAETSKRLGSRPSQRRAVVVITDGVDTSSTLTPAEVSGLASAIDVPVYVIAVVSPGDYRENARADRVGTPRGDLSNLSYGTGGYLTYVSAAEQAHLTTRELVAELRQQYFLAIESSAAAGWHRLEVKTRRPGYTVRARSGYFANHPLQGNHRVTRPSAVRMSDSHRLMTRLWNGAPG